MMPNEIHSCLFITTNIVHVEDVLHVCGSSYCDSNAAAVDQDVGKMRR